MRRTVFLGLVIILTVCAFARSGRSLRVSRPVRPTRPESPPLFADDELLVKFRHEEPSGSNSARYSDPNLSQEPDTADRALERLGRKFRVKKASRLFNGSHKNRDRIIGLSKKDPAELTAKQRHLLARAKRANAKSKQPRLDQIYRVQLEPGQSLNDALKQFRNDPDVEYAELNYIVSLDVLPNDPCFPVQWPLRNTGQMYPFSGKYDPPPGTPGVDVNATQAWQSSIGEPIIVAVCDSGIDYNHRDIDDSLWVNTDEIPDNDIDDDDNGFVDDIYGCDLVDGDGDPADDHGHGTHCAGIIAAEMNNGLDITGLAPRSKIMALKFINDKGQGYLSDAAACFYYGVENGVDVISNSWGSKYPSSTLEDAIEYASSNGVVIVASAGNNNNDLPYYPAFYDNVISVAATDSKDHKASFSSYGDQVDIAAPGVDVLSLRASGTSMGMPVDDYTTVASGTSMACPFVSAACALLLSVDDEASIDTIFEMLTETTDPVDPNICASGRLNAYRSLIWMGSLKGSVKLDKDYYSCSDVVGIQLKDPQLKAAGSYPVEVLTQQGDYEVIWLNEDPENEGVFNGEIQTSPDPPATEDQLLQVTNNDTITVAYYDDDDGHGKAEFVTDSAAIDCQAPAVQSVQYDQYPIGPTQTVVVDTNQPSTIRLFCATSCGGEPQIISIDDSLAYTHTLNIEGLEPRTEYFFYVEVTDHVGNESFDDLKGYCYPFVTNGPGDGIRVPDTFETIQEAIDHAWSGTMIIVEDGVYTGPGNSDIDFKGKDLTLKSRNGPEFTVIDCGNSGSGLVFKSGESSAAALQGFTIKNGNGKYTGIYCSGASPKITNCIIKNNFATISAGITCLNSSSPQVSDCIITGNTAGKSSAVNCDDYSEAVFSRCTMTENTGSPAVVCNDFSQISVSDSIIARNTNPGGYAAALFCVNSSPVITNCTIIDNSTSSYGSIRCGWNSHPALTNCIIWGNLPNQIFIDAGTAAADVTYCDVQGTWPGIGNVDAEPVFLDPDRGDYRLRWNPALTDKGTDKPAGLISSHDRYGNARVLDGDLDSIALPDIGAHEYYCSGIQRKINLASDGDTIVIKPGTYFGNINFEGKALRVTSQDPNDLVTVLTTVIFGESRGPAVIFNNGEDTDSVLVGFTVTGPDKGIYCYASNPTISKCRVNFYRGIALEMWRQSGPDIAGSNFLGEVVTRPIIENLSTAMIYDYISSAVANAENGHELIVYPGVCPDTVLVNKDLTISSIDPYDPEIVAETVVEGKSLYPVFTVQGRAANTCNIKGLTISNGSCGIYLDEYVRPMIENCNITRNLDAGIKANLSRPMITNCIFSDNYGHAIDLLYSFPIVQNVSITRNQGQSIHLESSSAVVTNSIMWNNSDPNIEPNANVTYCDVQGGFEGLGNIDADPRFIDPENGNFRLQIDSPCIDAGGPVLPILSPDYDADGAPRVMDGDGNGDSTIDMGPFEAQWYAWNCPNWALGDIDGDGYVGIADIYPIIEYFGQPTSAFPAADTNMDGWINGLDVLPLIKNFGQGDGNPCP